MNLAVWASWGSVQGVLKPAHELESSFDAAISRQTTTRTGGAVQLHQMTVPERYSCIYSFIHSFISFAISRGRGRD